MAKGHLRGTSYGKKQYEKRKLVKRNYLAKEVLDPQGPYKARVVPVSASGQKINKKELLKELDGWRDEET